jgi:ribosomal protein S6--L-glutamate ligase
MPKRERLGQLTCPDSALTASALRIGVLVEARYRAQAQPAGLIDALLRRGHRVSAIDPDDLAQDLAGAPWPDGLDLIVARGRSQSLFFMLKLAELRGARTVNSWDSIGAVYNKAEMAVAMATAGLPIPPSFVGAPARLAREAPPHLYPLILKPVHGDNARGLRVVGHPNDWTDLAWPEPLMLVQRYLPSDGYDLKLYGIGDEVWAVRKPSPLSSPAMQGNCAELVAATDEMRDIARRCRALFALDLYGVDCIETPAGLIVIEVNEFPNYSAVPEANDRLAAHVTRCAAMIGKGCMS